MKVDISFTHKDQMLIKLLEPVTIVMKSRPTTLTVPKGYTTDGATIPKLFWFILSPFEDYFEACVIHDYLCDIAKLSETPYKSRKNADKTFNEVMKIYNIKTLTRLSLYFFVTVYRITRYNPLSLKLFGLPSIDKWNLKFFRQTRGAR